MTPRQSTRLIAAELRLAFVCAAKPECLYIDMVFLDQGRVGDAVAEPDALYVTRINPYEPTLLYDVRRCRFLEAVWPHWFDMQGGIW